MVSSIDLHNKMSKLFNSHWPIVLAGMNLGSDKKLALAVHEAGGFPSLSVNPAFNHTRPLRNSPLPFREIDFDPMYFGLMDFIKSKGDSDCVVPISAKYVLYPEFLKMAKDLRISHWDIFPRWEGDQICASQLLEDPMIFQGIKYLRSFSHVIGRLLKPSSTEKIKVLSAVSLKGSDSAGGQGELPVHEFFAEQIKFTTNTIPHGGIGTPQQVRDYIDAGAPAVAVGTLFAACVESPLTMAVKQKMVEAQSVQQIGDRAGIHKIKQNALVFDDDSVMDEFDDANHSRALYTGIHSDGEQGLIMAGPSIKYVDRIRTAKETMEYLTSELSR
jgi:phosphoribosylformimino-5-aminoimidazole carboxamide ribonucleotide (ProFAR) isomerase